MHAPGARAPRDGGAEEVTGEGGGVERPLGVAAAI